MRLDDERRVSLVCGSPAFGLFRLAVAVGLNPRRLAPHTLSR
jgi:hypothetical protein